MGRLKQPFQLLTLKSSVFEQLIDHHFEAILVLSHQPPRPSLRLVDSRVNPSRYAGILSQNRLRVVRIAIEQRNAGYQIPARFPSRWPAWSPEPDRFGSILPIQPAPSRRRPVRQRDLP